MVVTVTCGQEGQQAAVSPRTSGRASVQPEAPPPKTCVHRGQGESTAPVGQAAQRPEPQSTGSGPPDLMLQRKQVHGIFMGARPAGATSPHARVGPPPRRPGATPQGPSSTESLATDGMPLPDTSPGSRCFMNPFLWENQMSLLLRWRGAAICPGHVPGQRGGGCCPHAPHPTTGSPAAGIRGWLPGPGAHPGCTCLHQSPGRGLPAGFLRSGL